MLKSQREEGAEVGRHTMANLDGFTVEQSLRGIYDISHVRWNKIVQILEHKAGTGVFHFPNCEADILALTISLVMNLSKTPGA